MVKSSTKANHNNWQGIGCFSYIRKDPVDIKEFLLVKHAYGSKKWSLPGGGIKAKGEPANAAAIREAKEETGYEIGIMRQLALLSFEKKPEGGTVVLFDCYVIGGENNPKDPQEISKCKFVTFEEAAEMFKWGKIFETQFKLIYIADNCKYGNPSTIYEWENIPQRYYPNQKKAD